MVQSTSRTTTDFGLGNLLETYRRVVLHQWFQSIIRTYPPAACKLLEKEEDEFRNPVGQTIGESVEKIYDAIVGEMREAEILEALDGIIRIRSVQDFSPGDAVAFIFDLREIVRNAGEPERIRVASPLALEEFDRRVDRLVLLAFEKYVECRERLFEVRINEVKRQVMSRLQGRAMGNRAVVEPEPAIR